MIEETVSIRTEKTKESKIHQVDWKNIGFGKIYADHMFVADYKDGQWTDLRIQPFGNLSLSPANTTLHYGSSVFEGLKAYRGPKGAALLFRPIDNFKRINRSAKRMCIPEIPEEVFMGGLTELIKLDRDWIPADRENSLYIRPFIFATDPYIGIRPSDTFKFIIFTSPVGGYYSEPVKVKIETEFSRACAGGTGFAKAAGNYAAALYPAVKAQKDGYHQLIWTDAKEHAYVEESGTMNVMFKIGGKIITAPAGDTILAGITRDSVLRLARDWGYEVEEKHLKVSELIQSIKDGSLEEAFGTGTAATITHIKTIGHEGVNYDLPAIEKREFSTRVLQSLESIKRGNEPDPYGWVLKV